MRQRIVLVKPPERASFNFGAYSLGALAAAVRDRAAVSILDATDLEPDRAAAETWARRPDLIGVTAMGVDSVAPASDFIRRLLDGRDADPRTPVVVGGHGASGEPDALLAAGAAAAVLGEGEITFRQIVDEGIRPGAPGLVCRVGGETVRGPMQRLVFPLDELPVAARDLMPPPPDGVHLMETSRGCPHNCAFCETTRFYQRRWRPHSIERIRSEVRRLVVQHDAWLIQLADDNFTASPKRAVHLCRALRDGPLPAAFVACSRGDDLVADPDLLPAMSAARILRLSVGVETLDLETAAGVGKPIDLATYREAFRRMRELRMFSVASLIVGLPGEDPEERRRSVELAVEAGPDAACFLPFRPLPGTPLAASDGHEPRPQDARDARGFTRAFFRHPEVRERLEVAAAGNGIRALLARGALERVSSRWPRIATSPRESREAAHLRAGR